MTQDFGTPLEWNSNLQVLVRANYIINKINHHRERREVTELLDQIVNFYKEIVVDLSEKEEEIWSDIVNVIKQNHPAKPGEYVMGETSNEGVLLVKIDDIDIRLRKLAKKKGYLTSNKEDPRRALFN